MQIILMATVESGQAAFSAEQIEGIPAPERRYDIVNGRVVLAGFPDVVLHHDADILLASSIYRMPTPAEQKKMAQEAQQASQAQESAPAEQSARDEPIDPPALDNEQISDPPASKKKASGG